MKCDGGIIGESGGISKEPVVAQICLEKLTVTNHWFLT
jgi:hypothetical protein